MANIATIQALNKIIQKKDYNFIRINGLEPKHFVGYEQHVQFMLDHYKLYGRIPDLQTVCEKFPDFMDKIIDSPVEEADDYLVDRLYEDYGYSKFGPFMAKLGNLAQQDSRVAYQYIIDEMKNLKPRVVCKGTDIIREGALERYELFKNRANNPEAATISTGLPELDEIFGGWEYGDELVTIVARTNQGKSWILLKFLAEAWKQGKRVGLYSGEMNHVKLGYRFDALFQHYSNRALVQGHQVEGYQEYIETLKEGKDNPFIIITQKEFGGRPTVQKIRNFVEENQLDIVGIDQLSLMEDGRASRNDPPRLRLGHIAEDLFLLSSEYRIPILALAQANREGVKKDEDMNAPGLENIKESDDIAHNSSKCIGIRQTNYGLVMDVIKNREGRVGDKLLWSWDIDVGHFAYIPSAGDAAPAPMRQQTVQQTKQEFAAPNAYNPF